MKTPEQWAACVPGATVILPEHLRGGPTQMQILTRLFASAMREARSDALQAARLLLRDCSRRLGDPQHGERGRGAVVGLDALDRAIRDLMASGATADEVLVFLDQVRDARG